jgi:hypothetical protein
MSRIFKKFVAGVLVVAGGTLAAACAPVTIGSVLEPGKDLHQLRTYAWGPKDSWSTGDPRLDNNRFFDERVRAAVEKQLARRGFEKTTEAQPDTLLHYHASVSQQVDIRDLDPAHSYCADHDCRPFIYDKGTLFLDFLDPATNGVIWRGWAEGSIDGVLDNQSWMEERIDDAVNRILARLPR